MKRRPRHVGPTPLTLALPVPFPSFLLLTNRRLLGYLAASVRVWVDHIGSFCIPGYLVASQTSVSVAVSEARFCIFVHRF